MNNTNTFIAGALLGAGIMYLLDPEGGRRRRALVRDKMEKGRSTLGNLADRAEAKAEHVRNRAQGLAHEVDASVLGETVDDTTLEARVRAAIGRATSAPGAIQVTAYNGRITLTGQILAKEVQELVRTVKDVRGVERVDNFLEVHQKPEGVSSLQGARAN